MDSDRAHAALVVDDQGAVQGWAQFGDVAELPGIKHRRVYEQEPPPTPDWRITCVFVDRTHRGQGVARRAVEGAIDLIAEADGGLVEAIPEATRGRVAPGRFLFTATLELFEDLGFELPLNLMLLRMRQQHPVVVRALGKAIEADPQPWEGWRTAGTLVVFRPTEPTPWIAEELAARLRVPEPTGPRAALARISGHDPRQQVRSALRQSKQLVEVGEVLRVEPTPHGRRPPTPTGKLVDVGLTVVDLWD